MPFWRSRCSWFESRRLSYSEVALVYVPRYRDLNLWYPLCSSKIVGIRFFSMSSKEVQSLFFLLFCLRLEPALSPVSVNCISGGLCYNCLRNDLFTTHGPVV